jgi:hypothetical protein
MPPRPLHTFGAYERFDFYAAAERLFRAHPFSGPWSVFVGGWLRIGPVIDADFCGAVMPARGKRLALLSGNLLHAQSSIV